MIAESRRRTRPRRLRLGSPLRRPGWRRGLAYAALAIAILGGGFLWLRSSSLVAVRQVRVVGLSGPSVGPITRTLESRAKTMTTLNLDVPALLRSVASYPYVHALNVSTHFPHGVTIDVIEEVPLANVSLGGHTVIVDHAGQMLPRSVKPSGPLPSVPLGPSGGGGGTPPAGGNADRITASRPLAVLRVLAAAPYGFLAHIRSATTSAAHGVVVQLRQGPWIYFGSRGQAVAKWRSALALLAARGAGSVAGAQYLDVSDPRSPSVGAHVPGS